jgi:hypothetical protein
MPRYPGGLSMNTTKYMPNIHLFSFTIVYRIGCGPDRSVSPSPDSASVGFFRQRLRSTVNVIDLLEQEATEETLGVGQRIFASIEFF